MPQLLLDVGKARPILDEQRSESMTQSMEGHATQSRCFQAREKITMVHVAGIERTACLCRKNQIKNSIFAPRHCFEHPAITEINEDLTEIAGEIDPARLAIFGSGELPACEIVPNEDVAIQIRFALSKLDIFPMKAN